MNDVYKGGEEVEEVEAGFYELLQKIMEPPLAPLKEGIKSLSKNLEQVEDALNKNGAANTNAIECGLEDVIKDIKKHVNSKVESVVTGEAEEIKNSIKQEIKSFEFSSNENIQNLKIATESGANDLLRELELRFEHQERKVERLFHAALEKSTELIFTTNEIKFISSSIRDGQVDALSWQINLVDLIKKQQTELKSQVIEHVQQQESRWLERYQQSEFLQQQQKVELISQFQRQQFELQDRLSADIKSVMHPISQRITIALVVATLGVSTSLVLLAHQFIH